MCTSSAAATPPGRRAMHLAGFAKRIFIVIRGESLKETLSQYLLDRLRSIPNVEVLPHTEVAALRGGKLLEEITLADPGSPGRSAARRPAGSSFASVACRRAIGQAKSASRA